MRNKNLSLTKGISRNNTHYKTVALFISLCWLIIACGNDENTVDPTPDDDTRSSVDIGVSNIRLDDIENSGNASDIQIQFLVSLNEPRVDHYRVLLVKTSSLGQFNLEMAESIVHPAYSRIEKTGKNIRTTLQETTLDSDGDPLKEDFEYNVYVLSVGNDFTKSILVEHEESFSLTRTDILEIIELLPIGTGGLEVDKDGNVYCADFGATLSGDPPGTQLYQVTPDGNSRVFASGFNGASGNTIGPDGLIYQSNIKGGSVSSVSATGEVSVFATGLQGPVGIVFDADENMYVTNCYDNSVKKVTPDGAVSNFAVGSNFNCPTGLAVDENSNLYVSNFGNGIIIKITSTGDISTFASIVGNNNGHLTYFEGNIYVAARAANRIVKVDPDGNKTVIVGRGSRGHATGPALNAELSLPNDLQFTADGKYLYINDYKPIGGTPFSTLVKPTYLKRVRMEKETDG